MSRRGRSTLAAILSGVALAFGGVTPVAAAGDVTPPVGSVELWDMDNVTQLAELHLSFSDPESGIDHLLVICDYTTDFTVPYATTLFWPIHDGTGGCTTAYGEHTILIQAYNGDGLSSEAKFAMVANGPTMSVSVSSAPTTGHPVTITPELSADFPIPAGAFCRWEFRWGTTAALDTTFTGDTFGGLLFDIPAANGGCGPWTFTLPWVPFRQFDVRVDLGQIESDGGMAFGPGAHARFTASADSTERRILSSNLPIAQVLPSTYTPIVGQPITYTRYLIGGASGCCNARWAARLGSGQNPRQWTQSGGATFTFTPMASGDVFVGWDRQAASGLLLSAYYDPPVRYRDTTAPVATAPRERISGAIVGATVPVSVSWSGTDKGWGIASYQVQKSTNGGTWTSVALSSATAKSLVVNAAPGWTLRFRVRAKDKAGNLGSFAYGPTFRVVSVPNPNRSVRYTAGRRSSAIGGPLQATSITATGSYRVSARAIAWVADGRAGSGRAKVYLDGILAATIDLGAGPAVPHIVFSHAWISTGTHTMTIVDTVTVGRPAIEVDGLFVLR